MQIIVPMAGMGDRFARRGYEVPKPLIEVDGKPIIRHVVELFPGETNFLFICNSKHISDTNMKSVLEDCAPGCEIVVIEPHKKGPVYTVSHAFDIVDNGEVIVNYCDFGMYWNYNEFLREARKMAVDGSVPSYRGFHPHMLRSLNYAFIREKEKQLIEIREKEPFTDDRLSEYASAGTYYFSSGALVKKYFDELMRKEISTNGEYYVSMVYNLMVEDQKKVSVYEIENMLQWGTPEELESYCAWDKYFNGEYKSEGEPTVVKGSMIMPMAGSGRRFEDDGYETLKQLIEIDGEKMFQKAVNAAPNTQDKIFVCLRERLEKTTMKHDIMSAVPGSKIIELNNETAGQAETCLIGIREIYDMEPIHIVSCDNAPVWNSEDYVKLIKDESIDAVIWCFKNYIMAAERPEMFGWVRVDENGRATEISVKKPVSSDPYGDYGIIGTFYFRRADVFKRGYEILAAEDRRVNGEFYVDGVMSVLIEQGYNVSVFLVDNHISFGTPGELKTYEYWKEYFRKTSELKKNR